VHVHKNGRDNGNIVEMLVAMEVSQKCIAKMEVS
jgi:hypothetical protein